MPPAAEQRDRRRLVGQPRRILGERRAVEVDALGVRPHRLLQPLGERARPGLVGPVEQEEADVRRRGVERPLELRLLDLHWLSVRVA